MNVTQVFHTIGVLPELLSETLGFLRWNYTEHMGNGLDDDCGHEHDMPLEPHESGRLALEFVMVGRVAGQDPAEFQALMGAVVDEVITPQIAIDVIMALAGMTNALASDEDLAHFGEHILNHEARS